MKRVGVGVLEKRVGEEDGTEFVEFGEGEGVKRVVGYVGGVEAAGGGGGFGWFFESGLEEAVFGGAPP